jgi:hypothetical protein
LDDISARLRDSTCSTHNTHNRPLPVQHTTLTTDLYLYNTQHSQQTSTCTTHNTHNRPLPVQHTTLTTDLYLYNTQHSQQTSTCTTNNTHNRPLPDNTQHSQQTDIHTAGGIRIHNLSRQAPVDPRIRPRGYRGRLGLRNFFYLPIIFNVSNPEVFIYLYNVVRITQKHKFYYVKCYFRVTYFDSF